MHELAVAEDLLKMAEEAVRGKGVKKVTKVRLALSDPPMLVPESLEFCFGVVAKGTMCDKAAIVFEKGKEKGCFLIGLEGDDGN